ncbi:Uma2 family endonuclease [Paraburkholderia madseniana]|uniref:Uma2 family endonuclease n=1 Tax=Paraburkholderia madseniana TaxID=2599607 RepID=UPI0038B80AC8
MTSTFGVRVPSIVWMPEERWEGIDMREPLPFVPDLCVEVLGLNHVAQRTDLKIAAYLNGGAREVMVIEISSGITYWDIRGEREFSSLGVELSLSQLPK